MKTFVKILFFITVSLLTFGCKVTPENQIKKQLKFVEFHNQHITKVNIIDTIYQSEVDSAMKADSVRMNFLKDKYKVFDLLKDSIRKTHRPERVDSVNFKYVTGVFDSLMMYGRWIELMDNRNYMYQRLNGDYYDNNRVRGYRVVVYYRSGRTNDYILSNNYSFVCPSFMLEPLDSIFKFRPRERRMSPPKFTRNDYDTNI